MWEDVGIIRNKKRGIKGLKILSSGFGKLGVLRENFSELWIKLQGRGICERSRV